MARKTRRDFSGGLVSYQSELIYQIVNSKFDNAINTKRGSVTKEHYFAKVDRNTSISPISTEFTRYRMKKMVVIMTRVQNGGYLLTLIKYIEQMLQTALQVLGLQ